MQTSTLLHWFARPFQRYCLRLAALPHSHLNSTKGYLKLFR